MMEVFIISFITSSISALCDPADGRLEFQAPTRVRRPFARRSTRRCRRIGGWMVAISMFLFGYTVLIGWAFYGEQFFEYMFGPRIIVPYRWFYCFLIPFGAMLKVDVVWNWGDIFNGLQVFPNVIGLIGLERHGGFVRACHASADDECQISLRLAAQIQPLACACVASLRWLGRGLLLWPQSVSVDRSFLSSRTAGCYL